MDGQSFGEEFHWPTLATDAGAVGRFIWYLDSSECEIDTTLRKMSGVPFRDGRFPVSDFIDHIHFEDQTLVWLAANEALMTGGGYNAEFRLIRPNGSVIWLAGNGRLADHPDDGKVLLGVNYDITEKRNLLERFELVANEMEHRVKNILTMVGSLYRSSAHGAKTVNDLSDAFLPRLRALGALTGLAVRSGHHEFNLESLVEVALNPATGRNLTRDIDSCHINESMAQTLALMLNELMTNAMKYGGLASRTGSVQLKISTDDDLLTLIWTEKTDYLVSAPVNPSGFGMDVLTNMSAATFHGRPSFKWRKDGMQFKCVWPLDDVSTE
jgi:two-component sensor histidine kinase